jgi:hypothetical protein
MEQRFEGTPEAAIFLKGRRVVRTEVTNDWGLRLQWEIRRNGQVVATPNARPELSYELPEFKPGTYEIVLQMWHYVNYNKNPAGEFTNSRFINVSNRVTYTV